MFAGLVLAFTFALLGRFLVRRGCDPFLAYLVTMAAAVLSASHWLARPHLFTLLAVVVLLHLLLPEDDRPAPLWAFFLLFLVWANFHGGFFVRVHSPRLRILPASCSRHGARIRPGRRGWPALATSAPRWAWPSSPR